MNEEAQRKNKGLETTPEIVDKNQMLKTQAAVDYELILMVVFSFLIVFYLFIRPAPPGADIGYAANYIIFIPLFVIVAAFCIALVAKARKMILTINLTKNKKSQVIISMSASFIVFVAISLFVLFV